MVDVAPPPADIEDPRPRRIAPFIVLAVAVVLAVLFFVLAGSDASTIEESAETPLLGQPAPAIAGPTLDGGQFELAARRGNWVVLNFFQSTCVPCKREHPELVDFAAQQAALPSGAELVTLVFSDDDDNVARFFQENGGDWPVVLDRGGQVPFDYGVAQVPETWIIDPSGRVQARYIIPVTAGGLSAELQQLRDLAAGITD